MRRTRSRPTVAGALAITLLTLTACFDSDPPPADIPITSSPAPAPAPSSPSPAPSVTSMTAEEARQQALAAYMGMQDAFEAAGRTSDPDYPELRKYTTGAALDLFTTALTKRKKEGILASGGTVHHAKVTAVSPAKEPTSAVVEDCMDTRKTALRKANGDPVPQDKGGYRLALADLKRADGIWKVTALAVREVGSCRP